MFQDNLSQQENKNQLKEKKLELENLRSILEDQKAQNEELNRLMDENKEVFSKIKDQKQELEENLRRKSLEF